ncbi:MAG TPA: ATP-binding protein [Gemmatirosa sp.]
MPDPRSNRPDRSATDDAPGRPPGRALRVLVVAGPALLVLLLAALALGVFGLERDARRWVGHSRIVLATADSLHTALKDVEVARRNAQRGRAAGRDTALGRVARIRARGALATLGALTRDNATQQRRLDRLTPLVTTWLAADAPTADLLAARGDSPYAELRAFEANEQGLLATREASEEQLAYIATVGVLAGAAVAALLALLTSRLLAAYAARQAGLARALSTRNDRLHEQAAVLEAQQGQLVEQNLELSDLAARLSHEEARVKRLVETVPSGLVETDAAGQVVWANAAAERILRLDRDDILTRGHADATWENRTWSGELLAPAATAVGRALATGRVVQGAELTVVDATTGERVFLRVNASPVRDDLGAVTGALAAFDDVTAEAQAAARLRRVSESGVVGVFNWTLSGGIVDANDAFLDTLGYTRDDVAAGRVDWRRMTPPEFADTDAQVVAELLATGTHGAYRKAYIGRDGIPVPVVIASAFLPGSREEGVCVCLDVRSLANAEQAERVARTQAERLQAVTAGFSGALTPQEVATVLGEAGRTAAGADAAVVGLLARPDGPGTPPVLELAAETGSGLGGMLPGAGAPLATSTPLTDAARTCTPWWGGTWCTLPLVVDRGADGADGAGASTPHALGAVAFRFAAAQRFDAAQCRYLVTIAAQAAQALERARLYREAQAGNEAKSGFMATVSHELRTPLNALIGYSDLLLLGVPEPIPRAAADQVQRMRTAARHLLGLIEEILLHARLEAGRVEVGAERVDLRALVDEVTTVVQPLATARGLTFTTEVHATPDGDATATTDAGKLRQILINLAGNAVKFTDAGGVLLHTRVDARDDTVVFCVTDTGVGIAADHVERIFDPFWQVSQHRSAHRPAGTGLGLSVTRRLARLLGGDVAVESTPGVGSTFTVRVARHAGAPAASARADA